jgi:C-terminal processing protease CtpA/Prc
MGPLRVQAILKHLGLLNAQNQVALTLRKPGGQPFQLLLQPGNPKVPLVGVIDTLHVKPSLARTRPNDYYWQRYLEDSQTLYIQYNRCANDPILPFRRFVSDVMDEADRHPGARVVLDLRYNAGGDSKVIAPLKAGLEQRFEKLGHIYVLIGSGTVGAAVEHAAEFKSFLHATVVGEPTGGTSSAYGDEKQVLLPNSKLVVQFTTKWLGVKSKDEPDALKPDVTVARTFDDIVGGRDAVLEAAIAAK